MKTFKTPKGTEVPLLDLKGKPYLQVAHRLVWFREEHPDWQIVTSITQSGLFRAEILDDSGRVLSSAHKTIQDKLYGAELAETGAVGRALAYVGYGTQFAPEIDEEDDLADAPVEAKKVAPTAKKTITHASGETIPDNEQLDELKEAMEESGWKKQHFLDYVRRYINKDASDDFRASQLTGLQVLSLTRTVKAMKKTNAKTN